MQDQDQRKKFMKINVHIKKVITIKIVKALTSSWSIGAIITALSAWTAGILYV